MAKLFIHEGGKDAVYEIFDDEVTIGRGAASSVQVADTHASKTHAVLRRLRGRWKMIDFESKNGTRVNGRFLNQRWLEDGDTIAIGEASLRFDAEGVAAGAPKARAVPAAPAVPAVAVPAAAPPRPAAPARAAAPPPAAARAPAAPAPASARAAPTRRMRDDEEVDEETGRRRRRRTGMSSGVIVVLGLLGAGVVAILFFALAGSGSLSRNQEVRREAAKLAQETRYADAIAYVDRHGDAGGRDWESLAAEVETWKTILAKAPQTAKETEAHQRVKAIQLVTVLPTYHPKNAKSDAEVAEMLRQFLKDYAGTMAAQGVLNGEHDPNPTFQRILQENAPAGQSPDTVVAEVDRELAAVVAGKRFGAAIERWETLIRASRTTMQPEVGADVRKRAEARVKTLREDARRSFDADLIAARAVAPDNPAAARAKLQLMIENYGIPELAKEARAVLDQIR